MLIPSNGEHDMKKLNLLLLILLWFRGMLCVFPKWKISNFSKNLRNDTMILTRYDT